MTSFDDDDIISGRSRRRCVKGRVSYLESDNLGPVLSEEIDLNEEQSNNLETPADPVCNETLETEEYDGEPVTIDLSEFLSETALLAEALAENPSESAAAVSDCHSQFRVTSSKTDPPLCPVSDLPSLKELNLNEKTVPSEDSSCTLPVNPSSAVSDVLTNSSKKSSNPGEENIPLEKNTLSPHLPLEVSISKTPMGESNVCQNVGEATVAKDVLVNTAVEALGRFPIVRCEKLNMENFVKKNAIKVGNWPLPKVSNTPKTKLNASKSSSLKKPRSVNPKTPKLFNKPISFNKLVPKNSIGPSTNIVRSILVNPFELKPPGVTYSIGNSNVHRFVSSHTPVRTCFNEYSVGVVSKNIMSERNSFTQMKKFPIITSVNKIGGPSKTLKIISPKKISPAVAEHKNVGVTPILPKPVIETITSPVLLNDTSYTVIEPYVDDPTSPVRPKPILTVPLEVIPAIEDAESNKLKNNGNELTLASKVSSKHPKSSRSVFLNGAIKQTSLLSRHKKEPIPRGKSILTENNLVKVDTVLQNSSDSDVEESMSINKAKTAVVDAMTSVFSKPSKKQIKSKQNTKDSQNLSAPVADSSMFGCQSYNNSLNDILFGFGSVEELMDENLNNEDVSSELSSTSSPKKVNKEPDGTLETQGKMVIKNKNQKTPSIISSYPEHIFDDTCADSDTLSASECGDDNDKSVLKTSETKTQKKHSKALRKKIKRGKRLSHTLEPNENNEYTLCKTPDLSTKKSQKENSIPQLSDNELDLNESKNVSTNIKKEANIEKPSSNDTVSLRKNTKETRVSSRGKRKPSNDNINDIIKHEPVEDPSEVITKKPVKATKGSLHFIHSRFKRNAKAKQSIKVAKRVRKQLSKPSDIIQEIKTITSGNSMVQKGKKIYKENNLNTSESDTIYPLSKSGVKHHKRKVKSIHPKSKKKIKTLKVLFKRSKQKLNSDDESLSSSLKDEISKSGSPCKENIPDLPCEKVSENPNRSVSCEEIPNSTKLQGEICPDNLKESDVLVSNLSNQSNLEIQNSEIKAMQDIGESGNLEPNVPEESTDPNNCLRSLDGDASSTLREELCSEVIEEPTELVSDVSDQNNPEIINSECEAEKNMDKSGAINHSVHENNSDPKDGFRSEDFSVNSISREEICSNCIEEPGLLISNDSSCSNNLEVLNSETDAIKDSNMVNTESDNADLTVSGENTNPSSGSSFPLDTDMDLALGEESIADPKVPVSGKLDLMLELKNSDKKGIDNECLKIGLTVPDESTDPTDGLKFSLDVCTSVDSNTDTNITTNNSLVESDGVSAILEGSKAEDSSDHKEEEQDLVKSKVTRKRKKKHKSCPKLKISKTMPDPESAGVNNWYVSERKASTDSAEFDQNSSKSSVNQIGNAKASPEMPEVLQTENASDSLLELSSLNSEVLKPRTKISTDNSLKSALVNDNISSEAVTDSNLEAVPTIEPPLHGNPSPSNESSLLSLSSENKSEMQLLNSVISASDKSSNSNSIEVEKAEPDHNLKVLPPNSPKNSKEKKKAIDKNHLLEELTSPVTIKTEPLDLEESTDQHFDNSIVDLKKDQNVTQDKESDSTHLSTVRRRGRPKKNSSKSMVTKVKESQPVSGCGTAEIILNKGRKRRAKITNYFKPQASKSVEPTVKPMESVPVPVEVTSVPEIVTPKGATLPDETSVAAALETTPLESTLSPATSLKAACADTTCTEKTFVDATCKEDTPLNGKPTSLDVASEEVTAVPPPKATAPQDATCAEESPSNANSNPKSPVKETSMDNAPAKASAAPTLALAPKDATCPEKTPPDPNSTSESPMEATSENVAPAKSPVALAQSTSRSSVTPSSTPSNRGRKRKFCPEAVQVPFSMGWMREMVHRANEGHKVGQKMSDIYYFTPEGIKLRSMVEIGNYLSKHSECTLTLDNFTFARELVFHEPLEIERSAKQASSLPKFYKTKILDRSREMDAAMQKSPMKKFAPPLPSIPKLTIKNVNQGQVKKFTCVLGESSSNTKKSEGAAGLHKNSQSCLESNNAPSSKKVRLSSEKQLISVKDSPKVQTKSQSLISGNSGRTFDVSSNKDKPDIAQIRSTFKQKLGENKTANSSAVQSRAKLKSKSMLPKTVETFHRVCSYRCAVARYQIPSVKCALCFCLFHPHCVPSITKGIGYACKSCVSAKLALYETIRNPKTSSPDTDEEDQDMPLDLDTSILFPVIHMKVSKKEFKVFNSSFGNAAYPGNMSIRGVANPASPMPVPYMPCLVTHLLRPPLNQGPKQIAPKPIAPFQPSQQVRQSGGNSVLPNCISANAPASNCRPILVRCTPSGRTVIHNGLVVTAPLNTNPLNALKSLTHDISHSGKWSAVSSSPLNPSSSTQSFSVKRKSACSDLNELPPKFHNTSVPSRVNDSILAASLSDTTLSDSNITHVNQSTWDENGFLTNHDCLKPIFKMLDICDLLRVGQVCKSWNHLSTQSFLWEKISFSNVMVTSWMNCCFFLRNAGAKSIDFQDIVHPDQESPFKSLEDYISILNNVEEVIFDQIPSSLLQSVVLNLHQLRKLECHFVTDAVTEQEIWNSSCTFKLSSLQGLNRLTKLKMNSGGGIILKCDPEYLMPFLPNLRHLTLTGFKFGSHINLECLSMHKELISLELGDCSDIEPEVYVLLESLTKLRCLRLENGGSLEDIGLVKCLQKMTRLEILELMNFKIPNNFENAFQQFQQLIHLNIWPDTASEGPLVNKNLLQAISHCKDLSYACWGIITEGDDAPDTLEIRNHENETEELNYEELFHKLVKLFPECRVEVKFVPRKSWKEFCSVRD